MKFPGKSKSVMPVTLPPLASRAASDFPSRLSFPEIRKVFASSCFLSKHDCEPHLAFRGLAEATHAWKR